MRILTLTDGRFWPSIARSTQLEGVFTVSIENARQSKSIIMCTEDLLRGGAVSYLGSRCTSMMLYVHFIAVT